MADAESQRAAFCLFYEVLQAAADDLLKSRGTDWKELSTVRAQVLKLKAELQAPRALLFYFEEVMSDFDRYKALLISSVARV